MTTPTDQVREAATLLSTTMYDVPRSPEDAAAWREAWREVARAFLWVLAHRGGITLHELSTLVTADDMARLLVADPAGLLELGLVRAADKITAGETTDMH